MKILKSAERSEVHWTTRKIIEMLHDGDIDDNIEIQRGYVWKNNDKKSGLIRSLIIDRAVPTLYFNKVGDIYELEDGKQRILTIDKFLNGGFKLSGLEPITVINNDGEAEDLEINGLKFSELPECMQNAIKEYSFTISFTNEASQEEVADTFFNLNNGQTINAATMNRVKAKSRTKIIELGNHMVFKEALSKTAMEGHVNEDLVVKAHAVLFANEPSTETKWIRPYMKDTEITDEEQNELDNIFDRIQEIHHLIEDKKIAKRIYTRTHMISIVPIISKSIKDGLSNKQILEWFVTFYSGKKSATISSIYNSAAGSGSGKKESVKKRLLEIEKSYNEFFRK